MDTIQDLLFQLAGEDIDQRWQAAGELVQLGREAVPPLLAMVDEVDWSVKHILIWALGELRDERALPMLITALDDPQIHVRLSAARALEKSEHPQAKAALAEFRAKSPVGFLPAASLL